jgi:hypothetical protein
MNNKIYLSIDIDFWRKPDVARSALTKIFSRLPRDVSKIAVMNHQQMEWFVSQSDARTLVNIDTHSDITHVDVNDFNCGTWVSYVRWRKDGNYIWYRSNPSTEAGNCNTRLTEPWNGGADWKSVTSSYKKQSFDFSSNLDLSNVVGVGLCLSPTFNGDDNTCGYPPCETWTMETVFRDIVKKYKLPYLKGRRYEHFGSYRRPPGRNRPKSKEVAQSF